MCQALDVSPAMQSAAMRVAARRCLVCGEGADASQTSAHLARVMFFCTAHGRQFHASAYFQVARSAPSTVKCWEAVDAWLLAATAAMELEAKAVRS